MFNSIEIQTIHLLMKDGKQDKAAKILLNSLAELAFNRSADTSSENHSLSYSQQKISKVLGFKSIKTWNLIEKKITASDILQKAIENVSPFLEVRKSRRSKKTIFIPGIIQKKRQQTLAIRAIIEGARKRKKSTHSFYTSLASEIVDAYNKQGYAWQKRNELHKIAHANRANLRFRWW